MLPSGTWYCGMDYLLGSVQQLRSLTTLYFTNNSSISYSSTWPEYCLLPVPWCQGTVTSSLWGVFVRRFHTGWPMISDVPRSCSATFNRREFDHRSQNAWKNIHNHLSKIIPPQLFIRNYWGISLWHILILKVLSYRLECDTCLHQSSAFVAM